MANLLLHFLVTAFFAFAMGFECQADPSIRGVTSTDDRVPSGPGGGKVSPEVIFADSVSLDDLVIVGGTTPKDSLALSDNAIRLAEGCRAGASCSVQVEQWRVIEIQLSATERYVNPFLDVEVKATFVHEDGTVITRPAFWYEGSSWRVRFAPTKLGNWQYTTSASNPLDFGLQGHRGEIVCVPYDGNLEIYKHGFLTVSSNRRYLSHADGTPFFYLGDTHWFLEHEDINSAFVPMVDTRILQGFTAYQSHPGTGHLSNSGATAINPKRYKELDQYFEYLARRGLVHAFGLGAHINIDYFTDAGAARLARYLCARYGAYPTIFFTSQEVDSPRVAGGISRWKPAFDAWNACDAYDHPTTAHLYGSVNGQPMFWANDPKHDLFFLQAGHGRIASKAHYSAYWNNNTPTKPFLEAEANYEQIQAGAGNPSDMVRKAAYKAIQSGSSGFGYGANGIWNYCKNDTMCGCCEKWGVNPWYEALDFAGGAQMKHLKMFYTSLKWWLLTPRSNDLTWASWAIPESSVLTSIGSDLYVAYLYGLTSAGKLRRMLADETYTALWFDPRKGLFRLIDRTLVPAGGEWDVPEKPTAEDWVLLVARNGFGPSFHNITASAGSGGMIFPSGDVAVHDGSAATFKLLPGSGHQIASLLADGVDLGTPTEHTFSDIHGDHIVTAIFSGDYPEGLISEWQFEGVSPHHALDYAGAHVGLVHDAAIVTECVRGQCMEFDGYGDHVVIPHSASLVGMSAFTLSVWIWLDAFPATNVAPVGKEGSYRIIVGPRGGAHAVIATTNNRWYSIGTKSSFGGAPLRTRRWYHLAATFDGSVLKTYLDGVLVGTGRKPLSGRLVSKTNDLQLAGTLASNVEHFAGRVDELRIYNRALKDFELKTLFLSY